MRQSSFPSRGQTDMDVRLPQGIVLREAASVMDAMQFTFFCAIVMKGAWLVGLTLTLTLSL